MVWTIRKNVNVIIIMMPAFPGKSRPAWQVTLDGYYKQAKNLIDDGQFGTAVILNNFNYASSHGLWRGVEQHLQAWPVFAVW